MNPMKYLAIEGDLAHAIAMGRPAVALPTADAPAALAAAAEAVRGNGCIDAPVTVFEGLLRLGSLPRQEDPHFARSRVADCGNLPVFLAREAVRALPSPARFWPHQWRHLAAGHAADRGTARRRIARQRVARRSEESNPHPVAVVCAGSPRLLSPLPVLPDCGGAVCR